MGNGRFPCRRALSPPRLLSLRDRACSVGAVALAEAKGMRYCPYRVCRTATAIDDQSDGAKAVDAYLVDMRHPLPECPSARVPECPGPYSLCGLRSNAASAVASPGEPFHAFLDRTRA